MFLFSHSVTSNSLWPHGLQHPRLPCPWPPPGACSKSVHWVGNALQPSHPLWPPSPPAFNLFPASGSFLMGYIFQCYSLEASHPLLLPLCPKVISLCLCLLCCLAQRIVTSIFLDSIDIWVSTQYLSFSFWLTSLCIIGSRFIHLIRTNSNVPLIIAE